MQWLCKCLLHFSAYLVIHLAYFHIVFAYFTLYLLISHCIYWSCRYNGSDIATLRESFSIHPSIIESIHFTARDVHEELISLQCDLDLLPSCMWVLNLLHLPWLNCFSYRSHLGSYHQTGLMLMLFQSTRKETNILQVATAQSAWLLYHFQNYVKDRPSPTCCCSWTKQSF